jgi:hypothetical protein
MRRHVRAFAQERGKRSARTLSRVFWQRKYFQGYCRQRSPARTSGRRFARIAWRRFGQLDRSIATTHLAIERAKASCERKNE